MPDLIRQGCNSLFGLMLGCTLLVIIATSPYTSGTTTARAITARGVVSERTAAIHAPLLDDWTRCADENGFCAFTGTRRVRYGANGTYAYGTFTGGVQCSNEVFGDPIYGVFKGCDYETSTPTPEPSPTPAPIPSPEGWIRCSDEDGFCAFEGTKRVRYGASGTFIYGTFTGGVQCSNEVFGDPLNGVYKSCDYETSTPTPSPTPSPSPMRADVVRFLEQATFGPTTELISHVQRNGFDAYLDEQFAAPASSYPTLPLYPTTRDSVNCPSNSACQRDNYTLYPLQNRFFVNAMYGSDQLRQRVAFALHQIFVVSGVEITQPSWMAPYLQTLDRNAFGNYRQLLYEITVNPAMGNYLDMAGNTKTNPNENYAREVLQLFSIGTVKLNLDGSPQLDAADQPLPAYTQTTVNNFARVFTGWRLAPSPSTGVPNYIDPMVTNEAQHDTGSKTLLNGASLPAGQSARKDLDDALDNIFNNPNVAPFISKQLIQHLVTSNPTPAYVTRVASVFNDNGAGVRGDLKAVVRAILLDDEARGDMKTASNYGRLRHPAQFITNILRLFDATSANRLTNSDGYLNPQSSPMGMDIFRPASVFSYYAPGTVVSGTSGVRGPEFGILSTSTAIRRANFINTIVFTNIAVSTNAPNGTSIDLSAMQALAGNPAQLVDKLNELMMHNSMSASMRDSIINAVAAVPSSNTLKRARTAVYLVASSSQYQVQR
jgi:uncharacterized protein (DUF1800 family)